MVDAIPTLTTDKAVKMFEKFGVYTKEELESRVEVLYEQYSTFSNLSHTSAKTSATIVFNTTFGSVIDCVEHHHSHLQETNSNSVW